MITILKRFFGYDIDPELAIQVFTWQHYLFILSAFMTVIITLLFADKVYNFRYKNKLKTVVIWILILLEVSYHVHNWLRGQFSVPLHLCSFSMMLSMLLLYTGKQRYFDLLFFIGPLGGIVALIFPEMGGFTYYSFRYYHFILVHLFIISIPLYYYKAYGMRVTKRSIMKTYVFFAVIAPVVFTVNKVFNMNYIFINKKPKLELVANNIPEWPYYIILFLVGVILFHTVIYKLSNMKRFN